MVCLSPIAHSRQRMEYRMPLPQSFRVRASNRGEIQNRSKLRNRTLNSSLPGYLSPGWNFFPVHLSKMHSFEQIRTKGKQSLGGEFLRIASNTPAIWAMPPFSANTIRNSGARTGHWSCGFPRHASSSVSWAHAFAGGRLPVWPSTKLIRSARSRRDLPGRKGSR